MTAPTNPPTPTPGPAPTAPAGPTTPASQPAATATVPPGQQPQGTATPGDKPLGPGGEKALHEEREARKALEKQVAELKPLAEMAGSLKPLAELLGGKTSGDSKTDMQRLTETVESLKQDAATERLGRLRLEVAAEKGLTPQQAARLQGADRDALAADADALRALFPATAGTTPADQPGTAPPAGTPRPDPSQGAQPGGTVTVDDQAEQALKDGKVKDAIALKAQALAAPK